MMRLFDSDLAPNTPLLSHLEPDEMRNQHGEFNQSHYRNQRRQRGFADPIAGQVLKADSSNQSVSQSSHSSSHPGIDQPESSTPPASGNTAHPSIADSTGNGKSAESELSGDRDAASNTAVNLDESSQNGGRSNTGQRDDQNGSAHSPTQPGEVGTTDGEQEQGFLPVLKNKNFLALWSGQVFSQLADKVYLVLMIAIIASRFQSEGQTISGWVSSLMIAFTIPAVLFGSIAGVFVDHWPKKIVLVVTNLLRGGLVLILPPLLWLSQGWAPFAGLPVGFFLLLIITFLVSTLTQFFAPAEQAAIPLLVERKHLLSANSLYTTTMMASVIIGFALGEPVLAIADMIANHIHLGVDFGKELLVGGSYAIAGLLLILIKTKEKADETTDELPPVWKNIQDGLQYLKEKSHVQAALLQLIILFSIFAALAVLAVRLAEVMPAIKSSQFGFLLAAGGIGMTIGAILIGQFGQRFSRAQLSLCGSIGMAVSLAALSPFTQRLWPTLTLLVALGAFAAIVGIPMQTAIQEETPEEMRGKVFGLQNNAINIALSLPLALAGVAETVFGLQAVFLGLALLTIAGGVFAWSISRRGSAKAVS